MWLKLGLSPIYKMFIFLVQSSKISRLSKLLERPNNETTERIQPKVYIKL